MSFRSKHRWTRRIVVGLAFAAVVAPAQARPTASAGPELGLQPQQAQQPRVISYLSHGMTAKDVQPLVVPYLSHGLTAADVVQSPTAAPPDVFERAAARGSVDVAVRPDDRADRFVVGDGTPAPVSDGDGTVIEWNDGLSFGIGALAMALALGIAVAYLRRPRIAL